MADCEIYIPSPNACDECDTFEARLEVVENTLPNKQNKLTAGANITISGNTISSSYVDTWQVNSRNNDGYVIKGTGQVQKAWMTDDGGNPYWMDINEYSTATEDHVNIATATDTTIANTGALQPGTYLLIGHCSFGVSSSGARTLYFSNSSSGSQYNRFSVVRSAPASGDTTHVSLPVIYKITSATTFYLRVKQDSGSTLEVGSIGILILKLK